MPRQSITQAATQLTDFRILLCLFRFTLLRIASIARERSNPVTQSEYYVKLCPDINRLYISVFSPDSPNHNFKVFLSSSESC